jgi:hypothetical protein
VIVVNQTLARRFWPGGGAVGGRLVVDQTTGAWPKSSAWWAT